MHPGAGRDERSDLPDGEAVLDDRFARLERAQCDLVPRGDVLAQHDWLAVDREFTPRGERPNRHHDIVGRVDSDRLGGLAHRVNSR